MRRPSHLVQLSLSLQRRYWYCFDRDFAWDEVENSKILHFWIQTLTIIFMMDTAVDRSRRQAVHSSRIISILPFIPEEKYPFMHMIDF
jgi:hypothetical protein